MSSDNILYAAMWEKKNFQFDECYLVKGRVSNNDATNNNTANEIFSQTRWLSLSKSNFKHSTMRIMQCNLCKILFFENYAIIIYAQVLFFSIDNNALNAFFDEMRIYLMHAFNERECTQSDF